MPRRRASGSPPGPPTGPEAGERPKLRRDAERNRLRIVEAAARMISEHGLDISHDEIAREAQVGVGTVYRRFPSREALLDAVYDQQLEAMVMIAEEAAGLDDPWEGLESFFARTFEEQSANRGLREMLIGLGGGTERARNAQARINPLVASMVTRAHRGGALNPSIEATDMAMIPVMINAVIRASREVDPELWRRWLSIILEGAASGPRRGEFPGKAPTRDEVVRLIGGRAGSRSGP